MRKGKTATGQALGESAQRDAVQIVVEAGDQKNIRRGSSNDIGCGLHLPVLARQDVAQQQPRSLRVRSAL